MYRTRAATPTACTPSRSRDKTNDVINATTTTTITSSSTTTTNNNNHYYVNSNDDNAHLRGAAARPATCRQR